MSTPRKSQFSARSRRASSLERSFSSLGSIHSSSIPHNLQFNVSKCKFQSIILVVIILLVNLELNITRIEEPRTFSIRSLRLVVITDVLALNKFPQRQWIGESDSTCQTQRRHDGFFSENIGVKNISSHATKSNSLRHWNRRNDRTFETVRTSRARPRGHVDVLLAGRCRFDAWSRFLREWFECYPQCSLRKC